MRNEGVSGVRESVVRNKTSVSGLGQTVMRDYACSLTVNGAVSRELVWPMSARVRFGSPFCSQLWFYGQSCDSAPLPPRDNETLTWFTSMLVLIQNRSGDCTVLGVATPPPPLPFFPFCSFIPTLL